MSDNKYNFLNQLSNLEQADYVAQYLPDDTTFEGKIIANSNIRKMLSVLGIQLRKFQELINIFAVEIDPNCVVHLIKEWERMLGIPDDCFSVIGQTLSERQRNILIKLAKMSIQNNEDFTELATSFGVEATVESGIDFVNNGGDPFSGGDNEARFTIVITFVGEESAVFPLEFSIQFGSSLLALLQCVFQKVKPANCNLKFIEEIPILGLYIERTIGLGLGVVDVSVTVLNITTAEVLQSDVDQLENGGTCYSQAVLSKGDKKYYEAVFQQIHLVNEASSVGVSQVGLETSNLNLGSTSNCAGIAWNGSLYLDGVYFPSGGFSYSNGDIIGVAIDYTSESLVIDFYKNNIFQQSIGYDVDVDSYVRPSVKLSTNAIAFGGVGSKGSIFTSSTNQAYPAPSGFVSLE